MLDEATVGTQDTLAALTSGQPQEKQGARGNVRTVQRNILNAIEDMASYLGHMQLTKQLYEAQGGGHD